LGVTFGIPGYRCSSSSGIGNKIRIKFTYENNTYKYEKELSEAVVWLKGLPKQKKQDNLPTIVLEAIRVINGQNYNS
jgi:hypothetical protein